MILLYIPRFLKYILLFFILEVVHYSFPWRTIYNIRSKIDYNTKNHMNFKLLDANIPSIHSLNISLSESSKNLSQNKADQLRQLSDPLLDIELVKRTIKQWMEPLPLSYLSQPLIVVGPSGVGKGRLIKALFEDYSRFFHKVITHTTRQPRPDEINGTTYHYISKERFLEKIENEDFIEWAIVHDNYYGVTADIWHTAQQLGKIPLLEIDIQGVKTIRSKARNYGIFPKYIFITPPSVDSLRDRLILRGTENEYQVNLRVSNAIKEIDEANASSDLFDHIILNNNITLATNEFFRKVRDWYPAIPSAARIRMMQRRLKNIRNLLRNETSTNFVIPH